MVPHVSEELLRRQQENEEMILDRGVGLYKVALIEARDEGRMADTMPGRWLSANFLERVSMKIRERIDEAMEEGKPGVGARDVTILTQLEPDVLAYVTLRTIMNCILDAQGGCKRSVIEYRLARELKEEIQHNHMAKERSATYKYWMRQAQRAPSRRTKQRCLIRLKKNFPDMPTWKTKAERDALLAACTILLFATVDATGIATVDKKVCFKGSKYTTPDILTLNPEVLAKLDKMNHKAESLFPKFEPMLCPPRPWTGAFGGGFVGKLGARTKLIRTDNRDYLEEIHNKIQEGGMGKVLAALNAIQATPWRINRLVFKVMQQAFEEGGKAYKLPDKEPLPKPPAPDDIKTNKKSAKDWVGKLKAMQRLEAQRVSKRRAVHCMLTTANMYLDEEAIWFAHNLDWRGRVYPMSSYLSPQGEELARALLEFARGLPLETDEAVEWLAIHGAGCWGYDKVSFADRVKWVKEHEEQIRNSAGDPLDCTWWTGADKPWMFLAWCFDWAGYLEDGRLHVSHLPVAMDGSCNGLQNFAAMLRHEGTARAVNLVPSETPNDIYQDVADKLKPRIKALGESETWSTEAIMPSLLERNRLEYLDKDRVARERKEVWKRQKKKEITRDEAKVLRSRITFAISPKERRKTAHMWDVVTARWIWRHIDRKLVKRPVMTYPYAVTLYGIRDQLSSILLDLHGAGTTAYPPEHSGKVAQMLRTHVYEAIQDTVVAAAEAMEWLQEAAEIVAEGNLPVIWESPAGMRVVQAYSESTKQRMRLKLGGTVKKSFLYTEKNTKKISKTRQAAGVAPNFVHSCDAAHLMLTVLACNNEGVQDFHMIHDSYGTHARNAAILARTLREEFVKMHGNHDVLRDFHKQLKAQLHDRPELAERVPEPPQQGDFNLTQVLNSKYFFA